MDWNMLYTNGDAPSLKQIAEYIDNPSLKQRTEMADVRSTG